MRKMYVGLEIESTVLLYRKIAVDMLKKNAAVEDIASKLW